MIALYLSLAAILFGFYIINKHKAQNQSEQSICAICDHIFHENEIITIDDLPLCQTHAKIYTESNWVIFKEVICTPDNAEESVMLYELKLNNYKKGDYGFIRSNYDVIDDQIQTKLTYFIINK